METHEKLFDEVEPGLVSCIIPVFNRAEMLRRAVGSVLEQTYRAFEIVIVDDGSTDETGEVCQELEAKHAPAIRSFHQINAGPGAARQLALRRARGEFVQYLDSDDLLFPGKFESQVEQLRSHPDIDVSYCVTARPGPHDTEAISHQTDQVFESIYPEFLMDRKWPTNSPLWRSRLYERHPGWSSLRMMEDWEHDLRAGLLGVRCLQCPRLLAQVCDHGEARASAMNESMTPDRLRAFAESHLAINELIFTTTDCSVTDFERYARKLFWLCRCCAEQRMIEHAERLFEDASRLCRSSTLKKQMRRFRAATRVLGWRLTATAGERIRDLVKGK